MLTLDQIAGRFAYTPDHEAFRQTVRSFLQKEGVPHVNDWEKNRLVAPRTSGARRARSGCCARPCPRNMAGWASISAITASSTRR